MSVCKYCKQSRTKKNPTTPNLFLFLEENDLKEKSLGNTPTPPSHLRNRRRKRAVLFLEGANKERGGDGGVGAAVRL